MFSTKPSQSLKKLFAGYHQPLPLSKRQTQDILNGLKLSFRNQLDQEYGCDPRRGSQQTDAAGTTAVAGRQSAAHQHLRNLLANPLFSYSHQNVAAKMPLQVAAPERDPMQVFDHAVARGMMTLSAATGCLIAKYRGVSVNGVIDVRALASGGVAAKVLDWLRSSGQEVSLAFLDNHALVSALVPFILAEGLENTAWQWMKRSMEMDPYTKDTTSEISVARASRILGRMVQVQNWPSYGSPDAAITTILDAEAMFEGHPLLSDLINAPWREVSWFSTVESSHQITPAHELFDKHLAAAAVIKQPLRIEKAHLLLCHPSNPNPALALDLFLESDYMHKLSQRLTAANVNQAMSKRLASVNWLAYLAYDTLKYLSEVGRAREAEAVRHVLQDNFPSLFRRDLQPAAAPG